MDLLYAVSSSKRLVVQLAVDERQWDHQVRSLRRKYTTYAVFHVVIRYFV